MIEFQGTYLDGVTSKAQPVRVFSDGIVVHIRGDDGQRVAEVPLRGCQITPPLGRTRRSLVLPDGARCETDQLEAVAALEARRGGNLGMRVVHRLESRWKLVAGSLGALILCVWAFAVYGIPFLAQKIAYAIPPDAMEAVSETTLEVLESRFLARSQIDSERAAELHEAFARVSGEVGTGFRYRLGLRQGPQIGPNAFALPSGLILVTDELVALAESDRELVGVFAHEIAHVEKRHGLRSVLQNAGVFLLVSALVGDVASITSAAATLPTLLAETGYSRRFEREADEEAGRYLLAKGWGTQPLQNILVRMANKTPGFPAESILSTHPETAHRVESLQALERSWRPGG